MLPILALLVSAHAVDLLDQSDDIAAEVCVELERARRGADEMPERERGFVVPEGLARARSALGRSRVPSGEFSRDVFAGWVRHSDPVPRGDEPLSLLVEALPDPVRSDRLLVRVSLRAPDPTPQEREPLHLVALVSVAHSMRSVPTRAYPMLQNVLPDPDAELWFYPKVDRLTLAREAVRELVEGLPADSIVALATFDRGANVALQPTPVRQRAAVASALDALKPGLETDRRGLDVVVSLVERMRSFCGDTRVVVFSDGPTGLGGDPDRALEVVAEQASSGVTISTVASAIGMRRVPQLEQLAWVGYGRHHYADTLSDAVSAFRAELAEPGWIARDLSVMVRFDPGAVRDVKPLGDASLKWTSQGVPRGLHRSMLYEVTLAEGTEVDRIVDVTWEAGSPIPDEWSASGAQTLVRADLPESFERAPKSLRQAWIAGALADRLAGRDSPTPLELYDMAWDARRPEVREDVELVALLDRLARVLGDR